MGEDNALEVFSALGAARNRAEFRALLVRYPALLQAETLDLLREAVKRIGRDPDPRYARVLQQRLTFLERCLDVGVETALSELPG